MNRKTILSIVLGTIVVLFIGIATVWAVTDLPRLIPPPTAAVSSDPFTGTVNGYEGLSMTIEEGSATPTGATLIIQNQTGKELSSGHSYSLRIHVLRNGQWYPMELRTDKRATTVIPAIACIYPAAESPYVRNVSWEPFIGKLEPGHYRVVWAFSVRDNSLTRQDPTVLLAAEFDIE